MNRNHRRERGRMICAALMAEVERDASLGLRLPECWDIVGPESATFVELLLLWEQTGEEQLIDQVREAYDEVVSAWMDAARLAEVRKVS